MHPFRAYISLYSEISDGEWETIVPCLKHRIFQANRIILKPGTVCRHLYFLENGTIRIFLLIGNEELTTREIQPPFLFTAPHSFTQQTPSKEGIQAIEESFLWEISREDVFRLLEIPAWKEFISKLST